MQKTLERREKRDSGDPHRKLRDTLNALSIPARNNMGNWAILFKKISAEGSLN